jgi:hypothetical protein
MTDRVHACLDGELPREVLTPAELTRLAALEASLAEAALALRDAPVPDLTARVMERLPAPLPAPPSALEAGLPARWRRSVAWWWGPREVTLRFRPALGVAGLALAALAAVAVLPETLRPPPAAPVAAAGGGVRLYGQFRLRAPGAARVELAGSFTGWKPSYELHESEPGTWTALVPLTPGVHDYTFVVDGQKWIPDPYAPQVSDDFGGRNSRLFLPVPGQRVS